MSRFVLAASLLLMTALPLAAQNAKGKPAPDFSGEFLQLPVHSLAELKGRVVLIEFWRTW